MEVIECSHEGRDNEQRGLGAVSEVFAFIGSLREADRCNQPPHRSLPGAREDGWQAEQQSPQTLKEALEEQLASFGMKMPRRAPANGRAQNPT